MSAPQRAQRIIPYLLYEDVGRAIAWLEAAFGFRERLRVPGDDGTITHAEVERDGAVVMLGWPGPDYRNPKRSGVMSHLVHVTVDDVDEHYRRAVDAGATIHQPPRDQEYGDRRYDAEDPEGHWWSFAQPVRDVPPGQWGAITP